MAHVIAVAGKGGVGKTTLCGMLIQYLCEQGKGPVLAVDADANSNLNEVLGVKVDTTLGDVREEIAQAEMAAKSPIPAGMSKADYAEVRFEDALIAVSYTHLFPMRRACRERVPAACSFQSGASSDWEGSGHGAPRDSLFKLHQFVQRSAVSGARPVRPDFII